MREFVGRFIYTVRIISIVNLDIVWFFPSLKLLVAHHNNQKKMKLTVLLLVITVLAADAAVTRNNQRRQRNFKPPLLQGGEDPDPEVNAKREFVKQMLKDAWDDYVRYAWGENELKPISQEGQDGGIYGDSKIGATIIDALDTLYIMNLTQEVAMGRNWAAKNFDFSTVNTSVSLFETNIRIVGGYLSAFALTGDQLFADLAYHVGQQLLPVFDTPTGIPRNSINPATGEVEGTTISMAGLGTLHIEFMYLSEVSGDPIFAEKVLTIQKHMNELEKPNGLYINDINIESGQFEGSHVTMGAGADSFYEYLLKTYIQTGDLTARKMYDEAMNGFVNNLVRVSKPSSLLYFADISGEGEIQDIGSHLACFAGGMFALGSVTDPGSGNQERDMEIGKNFTNTCHESYIRTATKIGPEIFHFTEDAEAVGISTGDKRYILRPEVIESYFILYRLTGDSKYRDWGWEAAQAIDKYCKAGPGRGYSGLANVDSVTTGQDDVQQTFFLAETLKYLYLLFSTPDYISLDDWVFNTEAHPLPIM